MTPPPEPGCAGTRQALLEAGLLCFSESGYEGTSLRMVAQKADRHVSLIAHHFGNKEGLYLAVFRHMLDSRCPGQWEEPLVDEEALRGDPGRAKALLRRIILHLFQGMAATFTCGNAGRLAGFRLWVSSIHSPIPELEPLLKERLSPLRLQVAACIRVLRPDIPAEELPFWCSLVHGQCVGNTMFHRFNQLVFGAGSYPPDLQSMAERVADVTLRAIGHPEA